MKLNIVPASTGVQWVRSGIQTFWRYPMALSALFFLCMAAMSLVSMIPMIGPVLALALLPMSSLVMMVGATESLRGRLPSPSLVLVGVRSGQMRLQYMLQLGAFYAVSFLGVIGLSALLDGGGFAQVYLGFAPMTIEMATAPDFQTAMWFTLLVYIPLSLVFWHAPGLVHWHGIAPFKAMFFSWIACARNWRAFAMFFLAWIGVFMVSGLVLSLAVGLLAAAVGPLASGLMVGSAMLLAAIFFTTVVITFRDCFSAPDGRDTLEPYNEQDASSTPHNGA